MKILLLAGAALFAMQSFAADITTNEVEMHDAPKWVDAMRINRVVDKIQRMLEWNIDRVAVRWHTDEKEFEKAHGLPGSPDVLKSIMAATKKQENVIHIGPRVDTSNFDGVFGHELAHVIVFQKYKQAIPPWLEEGLANYSAKNSIVNYTWLAEQPAVDVKSLSHPFGNSGAGPRYHYMASTAVMEMIASKCSIHDLLQLSVGQTLESYLDTFCGIPDLNAAFRQWVQRKGSR